MNKRRIVFICFLIFVSAFAIANLPSVVFSNNSNINTEAEASSASSSIINSDLENSLNTSTEQTVSSSTNKELSMPEGCDYYTISTPAELNYLSQNINTYTNSKIVLTADIDLADYLTWKPIGYNNDNIFNGIFDGNGYIISNLKVSGYDYAGLFGYLGSMATIKNLTIENPTIESSSYAGALAGYSTYYYGNSATIENITVINPNVKATASSSVWAGGIIGLKKGGKISNCIVLKDSYTSCVIKSTVTNNFAAYAGGIVGMFEKSGTIEMCANCVDVKTDSTFSSLCGGIVGYSDGILNINKSYNTGNITAENSKMTNNLNYIGGIAGKHVSGEISNCFNSGTISSNAVYTQKDTTDIKPEDTNSYTWGDDNTIWIIDCLGYYGYLHNSSYIYKNLSIKNVGGIAGYSNGTISSSYNSGTVDKSEIENTVVLQFSYSEKRTSTCFTDVSYTSSPSYSSNSSSSSSSNSSAGPSGSSTPEPVPDNPASSYLKYEIFYKECLQTDIVGYTGDNITIVNCYCNSTINTTEQTTSNLGFGTCHDLVALWNNNNMRLYAKYSYVIIDNTITFYVESNTITKNGNYGGYENSNSDGRSDEYSYGWTSTLPFAKYTIVQSSESNINISNEINNIVDSSDAWKIQSDINNGNPYLKDFYWISSIR